MSGMSFQEPNTIGRVRIQTNKGDLMIELWSRECPKACRNFVQLCMEGYYNGTIFHRIIPGFVIQGGDASGTGNGGDSIYGEPFPDEIHSRLRFRYRGILGVANAGKGTNTNGSQFFITLDKQESLTGLHTMFGKVMGDSIYTLSNLIENVELDKSDRPMGPNPPRIVSTEVIDNPFPDIVPRITKQIPEPSAPIVKQKIVPRRGGALSFKQSDAPEQVEPVVRPKPSSTQPVPDPERQPPDIPEPPVAASKPQQSSTQLMSEIERLQMQIKAAQSAAKLKATKPVASSNPKRSLVESPTDTDSQLESKFKTWTNILHSKKPRTDSVNPESSDWLNSVGSLKFAIDSKTAFSKDSSTS